MTSQEPTRPRARSTGFFQAFLAFFGIGSIGRRPGPTGDDDATEKPKVTILAIDDDKVYLDTIRRLLIGEGFHVMTSLSGAKGLDMLRYCAKDIQILLLDYNMPVLNGAETLQHVRKLNPRLKIIAVTGMDINSLPPSFREGVHDLVRKPFRTAELINTIYARLGIKPAPPNPSPATS